MIVVSNAGPLIALGKLGQLGLLLRLYDQILIRARCIARLSSTACVSAHLMLARWIFSFAKARFRW